MIEITVVLVAFDLNVADLESSYDGLLAETPIPTIAEPKPADRSSGVIVTRFMLQSMK